MRQLTNNHSLALLALFLVFLSSACDPCEGFNQIEIDESDLTPPDMYWEVTEYNEWPDGTVTSSYVVLFGAATSITVSGSATSIEVVLLAEDNQSGIYSMDRPGAFGWSCNKPGEAIIFDGIIPGGPAFFDVINNVCGQTSARYPAFVIDEFPACGDPSQTISDVGYFFDGMATNNRGLEAGSTLELTLDNSGS